MRTLCLLGLLWCASAVVLCAQESSTPDSITVLERQLNEVRQATARFRDPKAAQRAGYRASRLRPHPVLGERWTLRLTSRQQAQLNLRRPSVLFYARAGDERVLAGLGYGVLLHSTDPVPEGFADTQDRWRVEERFGPLRGLPLNPAMRSEIARERAGGRSWGKAYGQVALLHVWLWLPNPDGVFARYHRALPYLRAGLPVEYAQAGDWNAAQGTALLEAGACEAELHAFRSLVPNATREQLRVFPNACARAVARMRAAHRSRTSAGAFNTEAGATWREYNEALWETLSSQQRVRVEVLLGPGGLLNPRMPES